MFSAACGVVAGIALQTFFPAAGNAVLNVARSAVSFVKEMFTKTVTLKRDDTK